LGPGKGSPLQEGKEGGGTIKSRRRGVSISLGEDTLNFLGMIKKEKPALWNEENKDQSSWKSRFSKDRETSGIEEGEGLSVTDEN